MTGPPAGTLVVDLGSSAVKAGLFDAAGRPRRRSSSPVRTRTDGAAAELDTQDLCASVTAAASEVTRGEPVTRIVTTGQMGSHVWVDECGEPTGPAVLWTDRRDMAAGDALLGRVGTDPFYRVTGQRRPGLAARAAWGRDVARPGVPVPLRQWFVHLLTGGWCTDPSDASATGCLDILAVTWPEELRRALDVPTESLAPLCPADAVAGELTPAGAAVLGAAAGTPVVVGAGDGPCASLGADAVGAVGCLTLASSGTVRLLVDHVVLDSRGRSTCLASGPSAYTVSLPVSNVGFALDWARGVLGFASTAALEAAAASAADDPSLVFLPYLNGERFPHWDRDRTARFVGMRADHDRAALARAVLVGVACCLRRGIEHVAELGLPLTELRVNGGAARCAALVELVAGMVDVPLTRVGTEALDGAAWLATGDRPEPSPEPVETSRERAVLDEAYGTFLAADA